MPRDKTATHEKLVPIIRQEFLTYGYEKASVNHIARLADMSAAGLYRHFESKEAMFASLVEDVLTEFWAMCDRWQERSVTERDRSDPFGERWTEELLDFAYAHLDACKLLICCSGGSPYEDFEEQLIAREEASSKAYAAALAGRGVKPMVVTDEEWHLAATLYIRAVTEIIRHDMPREQAEEHIAFLRELLYPGMKRLFGLA